MVGESDLHGIDKDRDRSEHVHIERLRPLNPTQNPVRDEQGRLNTVGIPYLDDLF
jgi:hypothetical protein